MDFDELDHTVQTLTRDRDRLREDTNRLRREFDQLNAKLRYPGTKFLVDLEYKSMLDRTISLPGNGVPVVTEVFDTLPGKLHAVYVLSAYAPDSPTPVVLTHGPVFNVPGNAVSVAVLRQLQGSPTRVEARLWIYNTGVVAVTLAIRVWRRLGMGSSTA